jgi:hypothetical protein
MSKFSEFEEKIGIFFIQIVVNNDIDTRINMHPIIAFILEKYAVQMVFTLASNEID